VRRQYFHLETGLVVDAVRTGERGTVLVAQTITEEPSLLGEELVGGSGHFGEVDVVVFPRNDVPGARDANDDLVVFVLDLARGEDVKQLGVQRPPVELKDQITNRWSDKRKSHDTQAQSFASTSLLLWRIIGRAFSCHKPGAPATRRLRRRHSGLVLSPRWG